ncbi:hypothetical protein AYO44_05885 [Planctomycetaceae bacterium SCGC AG-212-F19]|nr:hypothetical protein AYO44_05885 [Planctomycetaceae bacterium SCGC AG-212-F19]
MDAVPDVAEQDTDEMRQEIDCTRSAMADKLEALEGRVMDTVQSAQETVEDSIQSAKDTVATVKRNFDIKYQVEQHPWLMVGGCFLAGLALTRLLPRGRPESSKTPGGPAAHGNGATAAPTPRVQGEQPSRPGVLDRFEEEIDMVKGIAVGYVMGLVRDSIKDSVPQLATQIDDVMNRFTTKLGSKPVQQL